MAAQQLKFVTAYGPKTKVRTTMDGQKTRTHQSGKDECDINKIMAKYVRTGTLDHQKEYGEEYGFATSMDLHESLVLIETANQMFNDLPSSVRTKMDNDPGKFLDFVQDPANQAELISMGLATEETIELQNIGSESNKPPAPPATGESGAVPATPEAPKPETKTE